MAEENVDAEAVAVEEPVAAEQEEQPAEQENGADDAQVEEPAADEPAVEAAEDAAQADVEAVEAVEAEAVADAEPEAEEVPAVEEAPKEEESKDEPKVEEAKEEAPKEEPKKKKGKRKKRKKKAAVDGDGAVAQTYWDKISVKNQKNLNWYVLKLAGKVGTTTDLEFVAEGNGGAKELVEFFANEKQNKSILFALLQCVTTDDAKSVRSKFVYFRFIGSGVKTITKAKMTTYLGKIDDHFPCKHLTMNINEKCEEDMEPKKMATELLRIGGAHKPDTISFGAGQDVDVDSL